VGRTAARSRRHALGVIGFYVLAYVIPILYLVLRHTSER